MGSLTSRGGRRRDDETPAPAPAPPPQVVYVPQPAPAPAPAAQPTSTSWFDQQDAARQTTAPASQPTAPQATGGRQPSIDDVIAIMRTFPTNNAGFRAGVEAVKQRYPGADISIAEHPTRLDKVILGGGVYDILGSATGTSGTWVSHAEPEAFVGPGGAQGGSAMPSGGGGDYEQIFDSLIGNRAPSLATLQAMEPQLRQHGMSLVYNARGTGADVRLPTGEIVDVIGSLEGPAGSQRWQWLTGGGGGAALSPAGRPSGSIASGVPGFTTAGSNWQAGMDPSYGFVTGEAIKALDRSSAARGTMLNGGTIREIMKLGGQLGSTEYQNVFNRNRDLASLGLNATQGAANLGSSYSGQIGNLASNFGNEVGGLNNSQAGQLGNLTSNQIGSLVNLITGQGNANASGTIGGANATTGTIANLTNLFGQLLANQKPTQNG